MKYLVSYSEITHYLATEIEAQDKDEADEKFRNMLDNGDVEINETENYSYDIEEQGNKKGRFGYAKNVLVECFVKKRKLRE